MDNEEINKVIEINIILIYWSIPLVNYLDYLDDVRDNETYRIFK